MINSDLSRQYYVVQWKKVLKLLDRVENKITKNKV